jgi:pullulanase-type alpha-1,6-glucosidase
MGHQPRDAMLRLQQAVDAATGRRIHLLGEGWNFGEVADGARFRQASQRELAGTGIATFSDRARDAARGGGHADSGEQLVVRQGWLSGLHHDPNELTRPGMPGAADRDALLRAADLVRVGLAGSIRGVRFTDRTGAPRRLDEVDYNGQPAGYVSEPGEVVNYVDNHDNQTLFDILALKLPTDTSREDRARVQVAGMALVAFSQGIAYYHAGIETLRSKSLDRNSYDSGDWFNRIDWTLQDNFFGTGLPPARDNGADWGVLRPRLANPLIRPAPAQIRFTRDAFEDLLRIRASSTLLRLRTADDVQRRLRLLDTGPSQAGTVVAAHLDGAGLPGAGFAALAYFVNVGREARVVTDAALRGPGWSLHPVHLAPGAADIRPRDHAVVDPEAGRVTVPPRTAMVLVRR